MRFDAILPLDKPQSHLLERRGLLHRIDGDSLMALAVQEARLAGAGRLVIPQRSGGDDAALEEARRAACAPLAGADGALPPAEVLMVPHAATAPWDLAVLGLLSHCRGPAVLLIDPAMPLFDPIGLRRDAASALLALRRRGGRAAIATVMLPWEEALHRPVVQRLSGRAAQLCLDRRAEDAEGRLPVFAGRAIVNTGMAMQWKASRAWPQSARFPFETLLEAMTGQEGGALVHVLPFTPEGRRAPLILSAAQRRDAGPTRSAA